MAFRIGEHVVSGSIDNSRPNSVRGWMTLDNDTTIQLNLTGDLTGQLAGARFVFSVPQNPGEEDSRDDLKYLAVDQHGQIGDVVYHERRFPRGGIGEFLKAKSRGESPAVDVKPSLYLEWFGPNGRVVAELTDPNLDAGHRQLRAEPLPTESEYDGGPEIIEMFDGVVRRVQASTEAEDTDDPYGLFPANLEAQMRASVDSDEQPQTDNIETDNIETDNIETVASRRGWPEWDDVIPGLDPEIKAKFDLWDEIIEGTDHHVPVATLFDPPLELPPAEDLTAAEATELVQSILAQLRNLSVELDVCEHFNDLDCYRLLVNEILPETKISPQEPGSGVVSYIATWDWCTKCQEKV